ncbi:hypothetical protein [uncultured Desulfovibrio sp.]|uniref:hypothetical protein n=1 Tax=uncultured Desulfovibrio sp. TaxID=167968 RepID=UPI002625CEE3|nr:hypothetical protein [uncultured Desulfovibrio sp.]
MSADELRNWRIHFSALPGMLSMRLGMREPQQVVRDALWKLGRYGESGDIWMARWLRNPEAKDWLAQMPKTPETILLYLGPPPDFSLLADMPQGNVIDASELITVTDDGLHVNMEPVEAALRQSAHASAASTSSFSFRKEGDYWRLVFGGKSALVKDTKGMLYIRHLLEIAPKQESTLQLRRVADPDFQPEFVGSGEETMDELELKQINDRLVAIDSELDAAKDIQDFGTQTDLVEERESLREHLRVSLGLGGRIRKDDDDLERNRKTVGNAITTAIKNIAAIHPELGRHLKAHISKGDQCGYRLEQGMVWST